MNTKFTLIAKLSRRLEQHISGIKLEDFLRIPKSRLEATAIPNIGLVELVSAADFADLYDALYISAFPHSPERERSDLITDRLEKDFANRRPGLAPYRIVGIRDHGGKAIGAAQFSVLMLPGAKYAVPYLQYLYVRKENQRQDMAEVLHVLTLAIATADGAAHGERTVPFKLFETEPAGHGEDKASQDNATQRAMIHTKAGAVAVMLRKEADETLVSPHVQPGLEADHPPLSLVWAIRPNPAMKPATIDIDSIGADLIAAYYQSLRDEGFPEDNIKLAESIVAKRYSGCKFVTMPLGDVVLPKARAIVDDISPA